MTTATATIHHLDDYKKLPGYPRDNRLADARREIAELRDANRVLWMLLNGEIDGWGDFGGGEVYLIPSARLCDCCEEPFYFEDDDVIELPQGMDRDWLARVSGLKEIKSLDGLAAEGGAFCCEACAEE